MARVNPWAPSMTSGSGCSSHAAPAPAPPVRAAGRRLVRRVAGARLRLIFPCCHPALAPEARVALTLRMVGGLTVPEIAHAFLVQEGAMGQRITRAKAK